LFQENDYIVWTQIAKISYTKGPKIVILLKKTGTKTLQEPQMRTKNCKRKLFGTKTVTRTSNENRNCKRKLFWDQICKNQLYSRTKHTNNSL